MSAAPTTPRASPPDADLIGVAHTAPCVQLATLERLSEERWRRLDRILARIDAALDRLDRRMWLAASACAAAGLSAVAAVLWRSAV